MCTAPESLNALRYIGVSVSYRQHGSLSDQFPLLPTFPQSLHPSLFHCSIFNRIDQTASFINQACLGQLVLKTEGVYFFSSSDSLFIYLFSSTVTAVVSALSAEPAVVKPQIKWFTYQPHANPRCHTLALARTLLSHACVPNWITLEFCRRGRYLELKAYIYVEG